MVLTLSEAQKENEELARQINHEARTNSTSPYAGKGVALLRGQVVAVADTPEEALTQLRQVEPDRQKGVVFDASRDDSIVDYVWRS
jgi:hypothetical protein